MSNTPNSEIQLNSNPIKGALFTVFSAIGTALMFITSKFILQYGDAIFLGGIAILFAGGTQFLWLTYKEGLTWVRNVSKKGWLYSFLFTFFSIFAFGSFMLSLSMLNSTSVGFLSRASTIVILILGFGFLKERFNFIEALAAVILLYGVYIVKGSITLELSPGFWWAMVSAITFGVVEVIAKVAVKYIKPYRLNVVRNNIMGFVLVIWSITHGTQDWTLGWLWFSVAFMGLVGPLFARMTFLYALKNLEVSKVTLIGQVQPVFILIMSLFILNERPGKEELIGGTLILIGCLGMVLFRNVKISKFIYRFRNS